MKFDTRDKKPKLWNIAALSVVLLAVLAVFIRLGADVYGAAISVCFIVYYVIVLVLLLSAFFKQIQYNPYSYNTIFYMGFALFLLAVLILQTDLTVKLIRRPELYVAREILHLILDSAKSYVLLSAPFSGNTFFLLASLIIVLSRLILYKISKRNAPTYLKYIIWCVIEAVLVSLLYVFLQDRQDYLPLLGDTLAKAVFALAPPHIIAALYFSLQEKDNVIRLMNYGNVVTDETYTAQNSQKITLFDNNGVMKLSVTAANLYFIESDDNYIKVWYRDNDGIMKQYMLRCKLKTVEDSFADSDLVRCHRQYIVNMAHVSMLYRLKDSYELRLDIEGLDPIPVTKTYESGVLSRFNSR